MSFSEIPFHRCFNISSLSLKKYLEGFFEFLQA